MGTPNESELLLQSACNMVSRNKFTTQIDDGSIDWLNSGPIQTYEQITPSVSICLDYQEYVTVTLQAHDPHLKPTWVQSNLNNELKNWLLKNAASDFKFPRKFE